MCVLSNRVSGRLQYPYRSREEELAYVTDFARFRGGDIPGFEAVRLLTKLFDTIQVSCLQS